MSENRPETNPERSDDVRYDADGNEIARGDVDPSDGNPLPDEVLVESPAKLAHEDIPVRTLREAEVEETRAGGDYEGAPSAAELRADRVDDADGDESQQRPANERE